LGIVYAGQKFVETIRLLLSATGIIVVGIGITSFYFAHQYCLKTYALWS
jgi:hypothetical protein